VTNLQRTALAEIPVELELVPSISSKMSRLSIKPGRLDPTFKPTQTDYFLRVPENSKSVTLDFATVNDKNGRCTLDGQKFYTGKGKLNVKIPEACPDCEPIIMTCYNADNSTSTQYSLNLVPQRGGDTVL